ncbi:ABC transporter permease [Pseudarthrobacter oxydans]|uniref:ABC transporter permease n=1 Tax=Pseudarthrobacter oxydans TaxID=1671 RepID=UPI00344C95D2
MSNSLIQNRKTVSPLKRKGTLRTRTSELISERVVEGLFILVVLIGLIASPDFLTPFNIDSLLRQAAVVGILAIGQYLVIVSGGFDLSVGAVVALTSISLAAMVSEMGELAIPVAVLIGASMGLLSGLAVTVGRIPPFVATLGVLGIARGLAFTVSTQGIVVTNQFLTTLNKASVLGIPLVAIIWLVVIASVYALLHTTRVGTYIFAIGGNPDSARLAGVPVARVQLTTYILSGSLAGLAGVLFVARSSSGSPGVAGGWELDTIAAVVIGGVSLFGGSGNLLRAMLGVLIYIMLTNIMNLLNVDAYLQNVLKGALIFMAVAAFAIAQRRNQTGRTTT